MKIREAARPRAILTLGCAALAALLVVPVVAVAQTDYYFSRNSGGNWDTTSLFWSTQAPPPNTPTIAWVNGNIAHVDGFGSTGVQQNIRNLTLQANISAQSLIFDYGTSGTNNYTGTYKLLNPNSTTILNLNLASGNITENALTGNNAQFANALINNNVTTPSSIDLTFLATGTYQNTGAFGNTELDLVGGANAFHDVHIGAGIKGPASAAPSNLIKIANSNGLVNANDSRVADAYFDGNGASLAAVNPGSPTPVIVNANNVFLNHNSATYTPGAFIGRVGADSAGTETGTLNVNGVISGNGDLMFAVGFSGGGGRVVLNNHNTYAGSTTFNGSGSGIAGQGQMVIQLGTDNALPTTTKLKWGFNTNGNGGTLDLNSHNQEVASIFTAFTAGSSVLTNNAASGTSTLTISGSDSPGPFSMAINDGSSFGGGTLALVRSGTGTTVLTNSGNSYGGGTTILGGTLSVDKDGELGIAMPFAGSNNLVINGGTLAATGTGFTLNSGRPVFLGPTSGNGSGMINVVANGNLTFNGAMANNGSGVGGLTLTGNGTLTLGGANTYSGPTTISQGTLSLASGGSLTASSSVAISVGGALAGTGMASGAVTVNGTIAPGSPTSIGQLNVASLSLSGGGAYIWKLADATNSPGTGWDLISVGGGAGTITLNSTSNNRFSINVLPGPGGVQNFVNTQSYTWEIAAAGSLSGNAFNASLFNIVQSGFGAGNPGSSFSINNSGGNLNLTYNPGPIPLIWKQGVGGSGNWLATGGTDWSGSQWNSSKSADFHEGSGIVTLQNPISSQGLEFDVDGYTVAGGGANTLVAPTIVVTSLNHTATVSAQLTGNGLTKTGAGMLVLTGPNTFTGTTTVSTGALQGGTASLPTDIINNGTLIFDQASDGTFSHSFLSGSGKIIKQNNGTLTLSGANSGFSGPVAIAGGAISIDADARLGGPSVAPATLTLKTGTLRATASFSSIRGISIGDTGASNATGSLDTNGFTVTLNGSNSSTPQFNLNDGGTFIKKGIGELVLLGAGTDTSSTSVFTQSGNPGTVEVDGGTLTVGNKTDPNSNPQTFFAPAGSPNNLVLKDGATFQTAASTTANASLNTVNSLTVTGNGKIIIYRTTADGGNSQSPSYTSNGTVPTPLTLNGTLTIDGGGTLALSTPRVTVGALTVNGPSTIQTVANSTFQTNFSISDVINDNGNPLTFKGGGTATQLPGNSIRLNTPAATSFVSGNWAIGTPDGTQGVSLSYGGADNTAFTTGNITVNPYGQLFISSTGHSAATPFQIGTSGQILTLSGIGAELADFSAGFTGALSTAGGNFDEYLGNIVLATDSIITIGGAAGQLTVDGSIAGTGQLQKGGAGNLIVLSSANTSPNNVVVGNGTITVGDGNSVRHHDALLPRGNLTLGETTPTPGTVDAPLTTTVNFRNDAQTIGNLASTFAVTSGYATQTIMLTGTDLGGSVLTINETGNTSFGVGAISTLISTITGTGSVVLGNSSVGTLTFTGTNDYMGGTTINGGKLALAGGATIGQIYGGDVAINANGILGVNVAANLVAGNPFPPAGANTNATALINTGGTMSIDSDFDASALVDPASVGILALNINNSTLSGTNGSSAFIGAFGTQSLTTTSLAPGAGNTYRLGGRGGTLTVTNGIVTGGANSLIIGSIQPNGSGTVVLAAANSFGGGTTVNNGTLRTTADGALGGGPLAVNSTTGITSTASVQSNEIVSSLSSSVSGGSAALNIAAGKTLTDNQSGNTTFAGAVALGAGASAGGGGVLVKSGAGTLEIDGAPSLGTNSALQVNGAGRLKFNVTSGSAFVGTGVTATVSDSAALELAGSVSALDPLIIKARADIRNNSTAAAGVLVSGTHQQVGGIDGIGTTQVNAGSDLTANHIIQGALVIGGTSSSPALVTIDASDSSGNSLSAVGGSVAGQSPLASGLNPSGPFGTGLSTPEFNAGSVSGGADLALGTINSGFSLGGSRSAVPEPSTLLLSLLAALALGIVARRRRPPRPTP